MFLPPFVSCLLYLLATMSVIEHAQIPLLKPILCIYDPHPGLLPVCRARPGYFFLKSENKGERYINYDASIEVDPSSLKLPWPSSFPVARQCKDWTAAVQGGEDLLHELQSLSSADRKKLPEGLFVTLGSMDLSKRGAAIVANSANAAIYMNPGATPKRLYLITKGYLLLWLLDGKWRICHSSLYLNFISALSIADTDLQISWKSILNEQYANPTDYLFFY